MSNGEKKLSNKERKLIRRPLPRPYETEEEAIIRRLHDAQRMARFRARRKKALEEMKALEAARLTEITLISELRKRNILFRVTNPINKSSVTENFSNHTDYQHQNHSEEIMTSVSVPVSGESKYSQLLNLIEEIGRDVRLTYSGSRTSMERLKTGIVQARLLVRDCLLETEVMNKKL